MESDLLFIVVFCAAMFFQALFIVLRNEKLLAITFCLLATLTWSVCAAVFLAAETTFPSIAMLFTGVAVVNAVFVLYVAGVGLARVALRSRRRGDLFE